MCETVNQQSISSHMVVYMACKMRCRWLTFRRCFVNRALSRNRSFRAAKPARHLFVWFAKHCLVEHCLSFRGDADECEKQFCFGFRICLAFFDSFVAALSQGTCLLLFETYGSYSALTIQYSHSQLKIPYCHVSFYHHLCIYGKKEFAQNGFDYELKRNLRCHVMCLYSVYCDMVGCYVLCLYIVMGWGVMSSDMTSDVKAVLNPNTITNSLNYFNFALR